MILHDDPKQRVEARQGLVTILDKTTGQTRHASSEEADHWLDHWTRATPSSLVSEVPREPVLPARPDDGG